MAGASEAELREVGGWLARIIVKLRQGSGKDRQGMVIKQPLKAPERP